MNRRALLAGLAGIPVIGPLRPQPAAAQAQSWAPARAMRMIVPFSPGGSTDVTARIVAEGLSARLGQPVVVENRPGASGNIGAEAAARAAPDGHTLLFTSSTTQVANPALFRSLPFDTLRDFAPISLTTFIPNLLVCTPSMPFDDVPGLIAHAKAHPGSLSYGSAGAGSSQHLAGALLALRAGLDLVHVPYRGGGPIVADLIAGTVQLSFAPLAEVIEHARSGRLRAIAVTTPQRSQSLPDVPTVAETLPGFEVRLWNGLLAPAATPPAAVERIAREVAGLLATPDARARLAAQGSEPVGNTPAEFAAFIAADLPRWAELVRISGAVVE